MTKRDRDEFNLQLDGMQMTIEMLSQWVIQLRHVLDRVADSDGATDQLPLQIPDAHDDGKAGKA